MKNTQKVRSVGVIRGGLGELWRTCFERIPGSRRATGERVMEKVSAQVYKEEESLEGAKIED